MAEDPVEAWEERYSRWLEYIKESVKAMESGGKIPIGPAQPPLVPPAAAQPAAGAPRIVVCSPHPDDEALIGALPLRLGRETGARVVNCAITLGSNISQKERRLRELECSCRVLGFGLVVPKTDSGAFGFDRVNMKTRQEQPQEWAVKVEILAKILSAEKPDAVIAPHAEDFNTTHIGTHFLAAEALAACLKGLGCGSVPFIETEYWHQMFAPNLMVGVTPETVALQLMATAEHGGEVSRNPYHLRQPARMMDNVRRGSEVVGGQGGAAYEFPFAELYRVSFATADGLLPSKAKGLTVGPAEKLDLKTLLVHFSA